MTHKILTSDARLQQIAALDLTIPTNSSAISEWLHQGRYGCFGIPGGPVHDATVIVYLLKPELFSSSHVNVVVDSREGPTFGQTIVDWHDGLDLENAFSVTAATPRSSIC